MKFYAAIGERLYGQQHFKTIFLLKAEKILVKELLVTVYVQACGRDGEPAEEDGGAAATVYEGEGEFTGGPGLDPTERPQDDEAAGDGRDRTGGWRRTGGRYDGLPADPAAAAAEADDTATD